MDAWMPITIFAALAQTARFGLQKQLKSTALSTGGATFARFVYSSPLVIVGVLMYASITGQTLPEIPAVFWGYALFGGAAQIIATMCVVALFAHRNFAVGITFKKTEVLMAVLVGLVILGEGVTWLGFGAILIGLLGVLLLSDPPERTGAPWHKRIMNRAAGLGIASGLLFACSGVGYRGASLSLETGDVFLRATLTLACVTAAQTIAMAIWLRLREAGEISRVAASWRTASLVGITSMIGSTCWFVAFTLQTVAYVKALGQIELLFSMVVTVVFFKEKISARELQGGGLLVASVLVLVLVV
ncbi:EamA/RhaT family transporter [Octadecabacter sp. G9-8]|uniref:EamA/RhaT family transporter n=1 Tax=Octadecabacter dasysiphoniae TaxID=2909341 RepID=A0ABS9CRV5_9RHOB|nr:EamA/RhaT family transporter [Octadecabacter dasysiphoniae]MCF2869960.1 EamA/RhaT family transporter [Octadecabacter dasysiphoniae]